jgi:hypothetical protein
LRLTRDALRDPEGPARRRPVGWKADAHHGRLGRRHGDDGRCGEASRARVSSVCTGDERAVARPAVGPGDDRQSIRLPHPHLVRQAAPALVLLHRARGGLRHGRPHGRLPAAGPGRPGELSRRHRRIPRDLSGRAGARSGHQLAAGIAPGRRAGTLSRRRSHAAARAARRAGSARSRGHDRGRVGAGGDGRARPASRPARRRRPAAAAHPSPSTRAKRPWPPTECRYRARVS